MNNIKKICILSLFCVSFSIVSMDQASSSQVIVCASLPEEVWKQIFVWVNHDVENYRLSTVRFDEELPCTFKAIKNIIPCTKVCKVMYRAGTPIITSYLQLADKYLEGRDKHDKLRWAINAWGYPEHKAIPLLLRLGADINYIDRDGETGLTYAIKRDDWGLFHSLLKWRADVMQPNRRGQVPLDLACEINSDLGAALKDSGGDPENKYAYYGKTKVKCITYGGYKDYHARRKQALNQAAQPPLPAVDKEQNLATITKKAYKVGFAYGCIIGFAAGCGGYWLYSVYHDTNDEQIDDEQAENGQSHESNSIYS